ncbi:MAG: MFS transporter [Acidimicrobiales bacterium]
MSTPLARPGFRGLVVSEAVSAVGDWTATVGLMVLALDLTGSSTAVAGILILRLAPSAVAGPLATRLVARWSRRKVLLTMHLARAGIVALIPVVQGVWWLYVWAFALEVCSLVFLPARDSLVPDLATDEELPLANALLLGSSYGTIPIGAALFGITVSATDAAGLGGRLAAGIPFWVDAATFLVAFAIVGRITELRAGADEPAVAETGGRLRDAFAIPLVARVLPAAGAASLGIGALFSLGIVFVRDVLDASDAQFGVLIALFGLGAVGGLGVLQTLRGSRFAVMRAAIALQGIVVVSMSAAPGVGLTFLGAAAFGGCAAAALAAGMSVLQGELGERDRVLAFIGFHVAFRWGLSFAALAAGVADDLLAQVRLPAVGAVPATRVVLFGAGLAVLAGALLARAPRADAMPTPGVGGVDPARTSAAAVGPEPQRPPDPMRSRRHGVRRVHGAGRSPRRERRSGA